MNFAFDSGEALPNANVPRLREYAKIMTQVSDLVESIEATDTQTDMESDFTIEVDRKPGIIIPPSVTNHVGEVSFISTKLKLAVDTMHEDDDIIADALEEPSLDTLFDDKAQEEEIPTDKMVVRKATNISMQFYGSDGVFLVSRTNLTKDTNSIRDHVSLSTSPRGELTPVAPVPDHELAALILSTVNPDAADAYSDKPFDMTAPEVFAALSTLLATTTRSNINDSIRYMPGRDSLFKHTQQYDPKTDRMKTSFQIKFHSNEDEDRLIIATHSLDTNFQLSFRTVPPARPFTPAAIEHSTDEMPLLMPYEPTLNELVHLTSILSKEVAAVHFEANGEDEPHEIDDSEPAALEMAFEAIEENVETNLTFGEIVENDAHREFRSLADLAITSELEERLKNIDPKTDEDS